MIQWGAVHRHTSLGAVVVAVGKTFDDKASCEAMSHIPCRLAQARTLIPTCWHQVSGKGLQLLMPKDEPIVVDYTWGKVYPPWRLGLEFGLGLRPSLVLACPVPHPGR